MIGFTKDEAKSFLLRDKGIILKNEFKLHEEIFENLYKELTLDKEEYELDEFENAYYEDLLDKCDHDDYDVDTDEDVRPGYDGEPVHTEYVFAICKYCGKISNPNNEGEFDEWRINE